MTNKPLSRRHVIKGAAASVLCAPAILTATRVEAANLSKMVSQMLICGIPGNDAGDKSAKVLVRQMAAGQVGGSVFLRHNVTSRKAVTGLSGAMRNADTKTLLAIDQEGGAVQRLGKKQGFAKIPKANWVSGNMSVGDAKKLYAAAGREIRAAGFNLNLAPVLDIQDPNNPVIGKYGRSFGTDPAKIAAYGGAFIDGFGSAKVACSAKHFPGHGSSRGDSHDGFVDISKSWSAEELAPFQKLASKAPLIMGGHLYHPQFSDGKEPVTFSKKALTGVLRNQIGYKGVIITDDLDMGAIRKNYSLKEACIKALHAGNDLLLLSNSEKYDPDMPVKVTSWIVGAVKDGRLSQAAIANSHGRVMALKNRFAG